jgi:hypothetical protein
LVSSAVWSVGRLEAERAAYGTPRGHRRLQILPRASEGAAEYSTLGWRDGKLGCLWVQGW